MNHAADISAALDEGRLEGFLTGMLVITLVFAAAWLLAGVRAFGHRCGAALLFPADGAKQ